MSPTYWIWTQRNMDGDPRVVSISDLRKFDYTEKAIQEVNDNGSLMTACPCCARRVIVCLPGYQLAAPGRQYLKEMRH